jgi:hypothetical protein
MSQAALPEVLLLCGIRMGARAVHWTVDQPAIAAVVI